MKNVNLHKTIFAKHSVQRTLAKKTANWITYQKLLDAKCQILCNNLLKISKDIKKKKKD